MIACSTSLWSADLANLGSEMTRIEPFTERWHLDVADGHYVPEMLFFPALVAQLRPYSALPFEVHLMTTEPDRWVAPYAEAGADVIIFALDSSPDPGALLAAIKQAGCQAGVSLLLSEPVELIEPYLDLLDVVTVTGTAMGIKGASMNASAPDRIRKAKALIAERGTSTLVQADGGIRRETVPLLVDAGADFIVPGSLMFGGDPAEMRAWLKSL